MARKRVLNDRYELDELPLGKGGMGEVWVGRDRRLGREVAVKLIRFPDDEPDTELVHRFVRESRITAQLQHPGVPAVYDAGTADDGRPFMVMQRIHGVTVADLIAEHGPLPVGWAAAIAAQTCAVLTTAHQASLVHRDLKPGNLILCPDGSVKVLDFGLAVALASGDSQITRTGQTLGTPAYMAPELVLAGKTTPRTDLYSVGCLLYEMLTGERPFKGATTYAVMSKQVEARPPSARTHRADVPAGLDAIIAELLAKDPAKRPPHATAVYRRLLPYVRKLQPLPGVITTEAAAGAVRMYASVLDRGPSMAPATIEAAEPAPTPPAVSADPAAGSPGVPADPRDGRAALARARAEASSLVGNSRYSQAAQVLSQATASAGRLLGAADPDVVSARLELANVRFDGGDYTRAAGAYRELAIDLNDQPNHDSDLLLQCRVQEATCHALSGRVEPALRRLRSLAAQQRQRHGEHDTRVLELRRQIVLLELGTGRRDEALEAARGLLCDARAAGPAGQATAKQMQDLLDDAGPRAANTLRSSVQTTAETGD